ncbi:MULTISPECIES: YcaO-like family protein [Pseudomonas]|jgi:ribosomal protein S12 methylthiotransferase accessory factor YcaO|nr:MULTISPECIES: YcaO-like family protein [Pseudomonas]
MNTYNQNNISSLPTMLTCQPCGIKSIPTSAEVNDRWGNGGSGIGAGSKAIQSALGEYFERRHFYMEVMPDQQGPLGYSLTPEEKISFAVALSQTSEKAHQPEKIEEHTFNLSEVYRSDDFSSCHIPTACISLSSHKIESDNLLYPQRDTCGCSFHWDPTTAIFGSLKEKLERQFLAKFWLTKRCNKIISPTDTVNMLRKSNSCALYKHLLRAGESTIIDISDANFPGSCILTVYGNHKKGRHVNYCAGMAYAASVEEAIEKSINELWQTYRFIDVFTATDSAHSDIDDPYLKYFLNCNNYTTYRTITTTLIQPPPQPSKSFEFNEQGLLAALDNQHIKGFIYLKPMTINNSTCYASKYISPDLFLHMNNSANINLRNKYSEKFLNEIYEDRKKFMVPFP